MSGFASDSTVEQVRAASDIVDVIGGYFPLRRSGGNFVALCPFHKEKSPSFNVSPHKQLFYCYGCHKGGDVFKFIQDYENITFPEALRRLADRAGIPIELEQNPHQQKARFLKESLLQIHEQITQRWHGALNNEASGQIARDYLARRGVSPEAVKLFRLGYAPDAWDDTINWARSKGYEPALIEQAGLIIRRENESAFYDRFRGRLMFPICDEQGRVIGFSGRMLSGDEKVAKYVNSPETPIFTKGKVIYGLDKSKRALLDAGAAIICEGQLDLIACFMAGVKNVVAPQGTALTKDHLGILKRYVKEVVLCFDSDKAGESATVRVLDTLMDSDLAIRVAALPAPHDPDSFIQQQGGSAFQHLIARAPNFFEFYLEYLCRVNDTTNDKGRVAVLRGMSTALNKTGNMTLVDTYAQKTALRLQVVPEAVRAEFKKSRNPKNEPQSRSEGSEPAAISNESIERPNGSEAWLLRILLLDDDVIPWAQQYLDLDWIQNAHVRQLVSRRLDAHVKNSWSGPSALLTELQDTPAGSLLTEALMDGGGRSIPNRAQQIMDISQRLRNEFIDRQIGQLRLRVLEPTLPQADLHHALDQIKLMTLQKGQPLKLPEVRPT